MSDIVDIAVELQATLNSTAIKNRKKETRPSAMYCKDCGDEIPLQRRLAVFGVQRCIHCQTEYERKFN